MEIESDHKGLKKSERDNTAFLDWFSKAVIISESGNVHIKSAFAKCLLLDTIFLPIEDEIPKLLIFRPNFYNKKALISSFSRSKTLAYSILCIP